jgi:hypothetical protein
MFIHKKIYFTSDHTWINKTKIPTVKCREHHKEFSALYFSIFLYGRQEGKSLAKEI